MSHDGHRAYFRTFESLVSSDTDTAIDTYSWHDGVVEHVSQGPTGGNTGTEGRFMGASQPDGARAFLQTIESLVAGDTDARSDVYERAGGATTLLSTGPAGGNGAFNVDLQQNAWTEDGSRVFFHTNEKLVAADTDTAYDLYEAPAAARAWSPRERAARANWVRSHPMRAGSSSRPTSGSWVRTQTG